MRVAIVGVAAGLIWAGLLALPVGASERIYAYRGEDGVMVFTNIPPERRAATAVGPAAAATEARAAASIGSPAAAPARPGSRYVAIYRYTDERGITAFTNIRPQGVSYEVLRYYCHACDPASPVDWHRVALNTEAFRDEIAAAARRHGVDEALVRAVMHAESAFDPHALSHKGAQGLMQLMPGTADMYGVSNAFDVAQNIDAGVRHLRHLLDLFDGDVRLATAAYNAGEGAVQRHGGIPPFAETQVYVERVGILHQRYGRQSGG